MPSGKEALTEAYSSYQANLQLLIVHVVTAGCVVGSRSGKNRTPPVMLQRNIPNGSRPNKIEEIFTTVRRVSCSFLIMMLFTKNRAYCYVFHSVDLLRLCRGVLLVSQ